MSVEIIEADYRNSRHGADLVFLLNAYAKDPMGGGEAIAEEVLAALPAMLAARTDAMTLLAYVDGQPAALLNAFEGFSTFKGKTLLNVHDMAVLPAYRGRGLSQALMAALEERARARGCCKLTLEVLEGNQVARQAYIKAGFAGYELDPQMGKALFWQKNLD
ncbi:GNAT family N-acetyltransferase [Gallaecimonas pentaromativorans]|uniref:GNAT family N-acetyltransferase n=1 Tax=Gallaecimonas pentaromativorans TaxID=584787 RepID=UPI003A9126E6